MDHPNEGLIWLRQQLAWERRLAQLRQQQRDRAVDPDQLADQRAA